MKSRLTLIFSALVVLLGSMTWLVQDRKSNATGPVPALAAERSVSIRPEATVEQTGAPVVSADAPMVHVDASGEVKYTARDGDTVSQLAIALLGSDSKENRDAVIAANPALRLDPDRVLVGQAYSIVRLAVQPTAVQSPKPAMAANTQTDAASAVTPPSPIAARNEQPAAVAETSPKLRYTARMGDTLGALAAHLLGGDTKANRDAIVAENPPLQQDADHLVAGQTYTIAAPSGMTKDIDAPRQKASTSQPDADEAALRSIGRTLRYTAKPGDTVTKLAIALLGSDTPANRDLIIKSNPSLKQDPDHLVAGQTYWIAAPTAEPKQ
ncbi:MAG: LysM peptidoglycan-binding domain-containing protein [Anaerolineae bacterium]|nr:LysM peptidoglycan-binding domain-containing protein [Phycisphaerae bacterium]